MKAKCGKFFMFYFGPIKNEDTWCFIFILAFRTPVIYICTTKFVRVAPSRRMGHALMAHSISTMPFHIKEENKNRNFKKRCSKELNPKIFKSKEVEGQV